MTEQSRRDFIRNAAVIAAGAALPGTSCKDKKNKKKDYENPKVSPLKKPERKSRLDSKHRGVNLTSWYYNDFNQYGRFDTLKVLNDLGVDSVSLPQTWYQENEHSAGIACSGTKTPAFGYFEFCQGSGSCPQYLEHFIEDLKQLDFRTVLKPHIDLLNGGSRTDIRMRNEADWAAWFDNYRHFIRVYATVAKKTGADIFLIGTELKKTTKRKEWKSVIEEVRQIFPGRIGYAANWDNYEKVPFWDKLDFIGIDAYFRLTSKKNASQAELDRAWQRIAGEIGDFSAKKNKKVIITEFGYQSLDGTNTKPNWAPSSKKDEQEQEQCYSAIFKALFNQPFIEGMYAWDIHWNTADLDKFSFLGKPAEKVVREFYKRKS